ncbi:MAG: hypothetical protein WAL66_09870 [Nitrososphaeraceae archaeon]
MYRLLLGRFLAPPRIKFKNFTFHNPGVLLTNDISKVVGYETDMDNLVIRVQHFRNASRKAE